MPVKSSGMIGTQMEGRGSPDQGQDFAQWVIDFTRLHDNGTMIPCWWGYYASAAEGFGIALYAPIIPSGSSS